MKVDAETEWTPVTERRRFRIKTGSCSCRGDEELRSTAPTTDTGDITKMELTDEETRKRALVGTTGDDDDEPAEK